VIDFNELRTRDNLPLGIPEIDQALEGAAYVFRFLMDEIFQAPKPRISQGTIDATYLEWRRLTEDWRKAFKQERVLRLDEWVTETTYETSNIKDQLRILHQIHGLVNATLGNGSDDAEILEVSWSTDWTQGNPTGQLDAYRLNWLSKDVGQFFIQQLEQQLRESALTGTTSASILLEPLTPNRDRWGNNTVHKASVNSKPIGAIILSIDLLGFLLCSIGFKINTTPVANGHLIRVSW
jgi:hypothetical protein